MVESWNWNVCSLLLWFVPPKIFLCWSWDVDYKWACQSRMTFVFYRAVLCCLNKYMTPPPKYYIVLTFLPLLTARVLSGSLLLCPVSWSRQIIWQRVHPPWPCMNKKVKGYIVICNTPVSRYNSNVNDLECCWPVYLPQTCVVLSEFVPSCPPDNWFHHQWLDWLGSDELDSPNLINQKLHHYIPLIYWINTYGKDLNKNAP